MSTFAGDLWRTWISPWLGPCQVSEVRDHRPPTGGGIHGANSSKWNETHMKPRHGIQKDPIPQTPSRCLALSALPSASLLPHVAAVAAQRWSFSAFGPLPLSHWTMSRLRVG